MLKIASTKRLVISCLIVSSLSGCGAGDRKTEYIQKAQESFAEQDYAKAKLGYKNAIQIDPKDIEPRLGLAKVLVADKDWRNAAGQYKGALQIDETNKEANIELGKLYLLARATENAQEHVDVVLNANPEDNEGLTLRAGVLAQQGKIADAMVVLKKVYDRAPQNVDNTILYATLLKNEGREDDAVDVIKSSIYGNTEGIDHHSVLVSIYAQQNKPDLAVAELNKIIEKRPDVFAHKQRLVAYYLSVGQADEAVRLLERVIKASGSDDSQKDAMSARQALVDVYIQQGKFDEAKAKLDGYIEAFPEEFDFQLGYARLNTALGQVDESMAMLDRVIEEDRGGPSANSASIEKAKLLMAKKQVDPAFEILNSVLEAKPNSTKALMLRGQIAYSRAQYDDAINDFRVVLKSNPDDVQVQRALADTHFKAGDLRLSETYLKQLNRRLPSDQPVIAALADISARLGKPEDAINYREQLVLLAPNSVSNLIELSKLYVATGQAKKLASSADLLQNSDEGRAGGLYFSGLAMQLAGDHERALTYFDKALELNPVAIEPLSSKTKSLLALDRKDEALNWLKGVAKKEDKNSLPFNLIGEIYLLKEMPKEAIEYLDQSIEKSQGWVTPYRNKSLALRALKNLDEAAVVLEQALKANATAHNIRVELAQLLEATGNIDGAIRQYEEMFELTDNSQLAANNLAMLLVTYRDDDQNIARAGEVAQVLRGSTNPAYMDTLGWVYLKQKQVDIAFPLIKEAASRAPDYAQIQYHLAVAYNLQSNKDLAIDHLEKALDMGKNFVGRDDAETLLLDLRDANET